MRISDWSSDVCSSDLLALRASDYGLVLKVMKYPFQISIAVPHANQRLRQQNGQASIREILAASIKFHRSKRVRLVVDLNPPEGLLDVIFGCLYLAPDDSNPIKSYTHTSELKSPISVSHDVHLFKNKNNTILYISHTYTST